MRKLYSLVLMAAALLIGTNAWGATITVGTSGANYDKLHNAFANADNGDTIQLTTSLDVSEGLPIWIGEATMAATSGSGKKLTLDLNGKKLTRKIAKRMFDITHGELNVITSAVGGEIIDLSPAGTKSTTYTHEDIFLVCGSTLADNNPKEATNYYSHLVIGTGVTVGSNQNVINIDNIEAAKVTAASSGATYPTSPITYNTKVYTNPKKGVAQGVRVDIYGTLNAQKYGIKTNGDVVGPYDGENLRSAISGFTVSAENVNYSPFIYIHDGAIVSTNATSSKATAVYASGYARWKIEGYCYGSTGLYAKGGQVELAGNAHVQSTNTEANIPPVGQGAGIKAGGSAIVIESNASYSGQVEVTIGGNAVVEAATGYAIEETVTTADASKVEAVNIEGGTIMGGNAGAIIVEDQTVDKGAVIVVGGDLTGSIEVSDENGDVTPAPITDFIPAPSGDVEYHATEVTINGKTTIVVSEGAEPASATSVIAASDYTAVKWQNSTPAAQAETLNKDLILTELQINEDYDQILTIAAGHKLTAGHVILGEHAQIIVEPGAKLLVTGKDGISANVASNIVLKSSQAAQAILLFNPEVTTHAHPLAKVDMTVAQGRDGSAENENVWTRFAMPVQNLASAWTKEHGYSTWLYEWDYSAKAGQGDWALVPGGSTGMKPWTGYTLSYNETTEEVYTFDGGLVGNDNAPIKFVHMGYNFLGNSYSSYLDAKTLVNGIKEANPGIDATVWVWDVAAQEYKAASMDNLNNHPERLDGLWMQDIAPMATFIMRLMDANTASESVNYASAVWGNPRHGNAAPSAPASAPRRAVSEETFIKMVVTAANGKSNSINLTEGANFTDEYESGYDASKFMNERSMNVYATINGENYSDVATNNIVGKTISMQTMDDVNYTISFRYADDNAYALLDKATNAIIAIEEGATYEFAAQPNSTIEGRFEIVDRYNAPTAIENTEVKANAKGIYTIMGQYLGEDFNALPAGVYVVDGVKIVK